jgi:protein-S-isoprenylcysteine O-methyltransferase Ste14
MWSLAIRNIIFTILHPGLVAGLVPFTILRGRSAGGLTNSGLLRYVGVFLFSVGLILLLSCIVNFAAKGKGTLSPLDTTKKLVVSGMYRFSRNPMYVGVTLMLIGEAVFFSSGILWIYTAAVFLAFNIFIVLHEEPRLKRDFGNEYLEYQKSVRRWF